MQTINRLIRIGHVLIFILSILVFLIAFSALIAHAETIKLEWTPPPVVQGEVPISGYRLYFSTESGKYSMPAATVYGRTTAKYTATIPPSMSGVTVYIIARSFNSTAESLPSNEVSFTAAGLPETVTNIKITP